MNHQDQFLNNSNLAPGQSVGSISAQPAVVTPPVAQPAVVTPPVAQPAPVTPLPVDQPAVSEELAAAVQSSPAAPDPIKIAEATTSAISTTEALNDSNIAVDSSTPIVEQAPPKAKASPSTDSEVIEEIEELEQKVNSSQMPEELREKALRSIERLYRMAKRGSYTGEFETVEKYIYWITSIPWGTYTEDRLDVANAKGIMDKTHYGMDTVKNLVLDYLAVMQLKNSAIAAQGQNSAQPTVTPGAASASVTPVAPEMAILRGSSANAPVMLFVGLQGVGKTSIAKSIAMAMGRDFTRVALGAIGSVQALRGQSKAFLDAEPGQVVKALIRTKSMNPVILLDEIDKASGQSGLLNDIMAALLEILDPEQNSAFIDHYIDHPIDLSKVFFICTANNLGTLSAALLDRMEVIRFTSYNDEEKTTIAKNFSFPKVIENTGLRPDQIVIEENVWPLLVRPVGFDAGLRQLERNLATMVRAVARKIVEGAPAPIVITTENLKEFVLPDQGPLS
ncbi:MAG: AAA family ATPase [Candidatus Dojkabacteria bacterium]|nr:MAG: AAA family ATPase [Candidatus Dojkabacteria bacterium]